MPSTNIVTLIQSAELGTDSVLPTLDPRFIPDARPNVRELSARWLRAGAQGGLRLANRLDPECQYA